MAAYDPFVISFLLIVGICIGLCIAWMCRLEPAKQNVVEDTPEITRLQWLFGIRNAADRGYELHKLLNDLPGLVEERGAESASPSAQMIVMYHMILERTVYQLQWATLDHNDHMVIGEIVAAWRQVMDIEGGDAEDRLRKMLPALQDDGSWKWRGSDTYEKRKASSK